GAGSACRGRADWARLRRGESGASPTTGKVTWWGSVQVRRPTIGGDLSVTRVKMPPPKFEVPEKSRVWPFWLTCHWNAPVGWIVSEILVSAFGSTVQVPEIVAPSGAVVFTAAGSK